MRDRTFLVVTIAAMLVGALLLVMLWSAIPARASHVPTRCSLMTQELNTRRSPDVRLRSLLCDIAHSRAIQLAHGQRGPTGNGHNVAYVRWRLDRAGVCYSNVGEAIAWSTRVTADHFIDIWWASPKHRAVLDGDRYDRGGGSWRASEIGRGSYAVYLVLDTTNGFSQGCN